MSLGDGPIETTVSYILLAYTLIYHLPRFIRWLRHANYTDDSFYEKQVKPNSPIDYL